MRLSAVSAALVAALLSLSACQDATGVGLGLLDDDAPDPNLRTVDATAVDTVDAPTSTAGFASPQSTQPQARVLAGRVLDPLYGDAAATAYVDALRPSSVPDDFDGAAVTSVTLELVRDYTYGDTTATLPMDVRFVEGNWSPDGLPADTVLGTSAVLATVSVAPTDSVVVFALPAAMLAGRDSIFTSPNFGSLFEGFALSVAEVGGPLPGAIAGFNVADTRSRLRVATATDTVSFALSEVYSYVTQSDPAMPPAGVLPLRAGRGGAVLSFDVTPLGPVPLARAQLALPVGSSPTEGSFKRPVAREVAVFAIDADDGDVSQLTVARTSAGGLRTIQGTIITSVVQSLLLGQGAFEPRLQVRFANTPASLDVLPLAPPGSGGAVAQLLLTVVAPAP